jgi:hypothetical protein
MQLPIQLWVPIGCGIVAHDEELFDDGSTSGSVTSSSTSSPSFEDVSAEISPATRPTACPLTPTSVMKVNDTSPVYASNDGDITGSSVCEDFDSSTAVEDPILVSGNVAISRSWGSCAELVAQYKASTNKNFIHPPRLQAWKVPWPCCESPCHEQG